MTIRTRLVAAALAALFALTLLAGVGLYASQRHVESLGDVYERDVRALLSLQRVDQLLGDAKFRVAGVLLDVLPWQGALNHLRETRANLARSWEGAAAIFASEEVASDAERERLRAGWSVVLKTLSRIESAYEGKNRTQLTEILESDWPELHKAFAKPLAELLPRAEARARATYEMAQRDARRTSWLLLALGTGAFATLCAIMAHVYRAIVRSLARATSTVQAIADGDLSRDIDAAGQNEIEKLLALLQRMQGALRRLLGDVRDSVQVVQQ
ncbi:MAG: HAMP domain-containing protein, partial [Burkholderiaceae bacterium]|nr:HAMP domain-containing protein [Burkholderiaceae bacterium]